MGPDGRGESGTLVHFLLNSTDSEIVQKKGGEVGDDRPALFSCEYLPGLDYSPTTTFTFTGFGFSCFGLRPQNLTIVSGSNLLAVSRTSKCHTEPTHIQAGYLCVGHYSQKLPFTISKPDQDQNHGHRYGVWSIMSFLFNCGPTKTRFCLRSNLRYSSVQNFR